jgi:hypothetical protein
LIGVLGLAPECGTEYLDTCMTNRDILVRSLTSASARIDISTEMSFDPSFEEQELLAETIEREGARMTTRELVTGRLLAAGFAAAVVALWLLTAPRSFAPVPALVCLAVLVLAMLGPSTLRSARAARPSSASCRCCSRCHPRSCRSRSPSRWRSPGCRT